jgi:hypothetical protein
MTLDDLLATITASQREQWHRVDDGSVTFLDRFSQVSAWPQGEERVWLEHSSHHSRVVYTPDVAIGMAWGLQRDPDDTTFREDWLERFADPKAWAAWLDVLYNGQPVDRRLYVVVDGGRCKLPLPEQIFAKGIDWPREKRLWVPEVDAKLLRLVNEIDNGREYDRYLNQAGFDVAGA